MSSQYFLAIISSISSIIFITPNGNLVSIKQSLFILLPQPLTTPGLLSVCISFLVLGISSKENYKTSLTVNNVTTLQPGYSKCQYFSPFIGLNYIPSYDCTAFGLSIHLLMTFGLFPCVGCCDLYHYEHSCACI